MVVGESTTITVNSSKTARDDSTVTHQIDWLKSESIWKHSLAGKDPIIVHKERTDLLYSSASDSVVYQSDE